MAGRVDLYQRLLPFQSVCFLLDGLSQLAETPESLTAHSDDLPFLRATLVASLEQAAKALRIDPFDFESAAQPLFEQLQTN